MLSKQLLTISDLSRWNEALQEEDRRNSYLSFTANFLWRRHCPVLLVEAGERLSMEFVSRLNGNFYLWPIGSGDLSAALNALIRDGGEGFTLRYLDRAQAEALESLFPGRFSVEEDRDSADYLYSIHSFATLIGKKLHGKRNFCNRFEAAHRWEALPLQREHFPACRSLFERWAEGRQDAEDERRTLHTAFTYWEELQFEGTLLLCENEPLAFSAGRQLTDDTFEIYFEKALSGVPGAYPMIARDTARQLLSAHPTLTTLNRQEDMGLPGLRKAKEEWYPEALQMKYTAVLKF